MEKLAESNDPVIEKAFTQNRWFTPENTKHSLHAWSHQLAPVRLHKWLSSYEVDDVVQARVAVIMAGNIPLVGLHDLLCVLLCGQHAIVKMSEDDTVLMQQLIDELLRIEPRFASLITVSKEKLPSDMDAVIATGSNNTNRYFEYYFRNKRSLLRRSRTSVAVLTGNETPEDLAAIGNDIFTYFGLGCRNVSKLYVPQDYDFTSFFESIEPWNSIIHHHKYANNYTYHKAILLMNLTLHLDNGFLLVKEDARIASPLSLLFYSTYANEEALMMELHEKAGEIQCIVSRRAMEGAIPPGKAQEPELWDYADGVDTMRFLLGG
jgi:hypothetical protein